jgi:Zn-finger protein
MKYHCIECKTPFVFVPSLKERGMTEAEAKSIFIDAKGGRCSNCYIAHQNLESGNLIARQILVREYGFSEKAANAEKNPEKTITILKNW